MTTEEKAKAYDEALERARVLGDGKHFVPHGMTVKEYIFPELRESEDERMAEMAIKAVLSPEAQSCIKSWGVNPDDVIAWLEKKKYDRMKPVYDNQDSFESALEKAWKDYNDSGARTVDDCEDNYVECAHAKGFREGYLFGLEKKKEQKLTATINGEPIPTENQSVDIPLAEWSEEDEKTLKSIIGDLFCGTDFNMELKFAASKKVNWLKEKLKSLRPSWKPSEEQMEELCAALTPGATFDYDILNELYEHLKKL